MIDKFQYIMSSTENTNVITVCYIYLIIDANVWSHEVQNYDTYTYLYTCIVTKKGRNKTTESLKKHFSFVYIMKST